MASILAGRDGTGGTTDATTRPSLGWSEQDGDGQPARSSPLKSRKAGHER
jgi:hypothetical protein